MHENIIIVGYPKSGTTWLSRLVAELVSCPLQGDWGFENIVALYREGSDRNSQFQCYKSHHTYPEIKNVSKLKIYKIIYIIRDPRDIVISSIHYFSFLPKLLAKNVKSSNINRVLRKTYNKLVSNKEKKRQMIQTVLNGNIRMNPWFVSSWEEHYTSYSDKNILFVKYEDLIDSPLIESKKILTYLGITYNEEHIKKCIENQSFQKKKLKTIRNNEIKLKKLMRKGAYGYWKKEFTEDEINHFHEKFKNSNEFYEF